MGLKSLSVFFFLGVPVMSWAQQQYKLFELKQEDVIWQNVYSYSGKSDSLRPAVVTMLKSKFFTFNVIRNEKGYNGEIKHYRISAKRYNRTYMNTPRMYWDGDWTGKFIVEVVDNSYRVTVYALYYESVERSTGYYKTEKPVKGRLLDAVTNKHKDRFRKSELANLDLLSISLKDQFDIAQTGRIED